MTAEYLDSFLPRCVPSLANTTATFYGRTGRIGLSPLGRRSDDLGDVGGGAGVWPRGFWRWLSPAAAARRFSVGRTSTTLRTSTFS